MQTETTEKETEKVEVEIEVAVQPLQTMLDQPMKKNVGKTEKLTTERYVK